MPNPKPLSTPSSPAQANLVFSSSSLQIHIKSTHIAKMTELKVGDTFPEGVAFQYIPVTPETEEVTSCGIPVKFDASAGMFASPPHRRRRRCRR